MKETDGPLARLAERRPRVIDLDVTRMRDALSLLGDPHLRLPPVIHVAGTNGKGSVIAYLRAMLEAAGKSVHVYTSPHLVRFNERIVVAGKEISDAALSDALLRCERATGDAPLTYFEAATCAAFLAFADTPADVLLLEVGLGGRLDATNVIDRPLASVVAPVGLDHMEFLGGELRLIAAEKAGVFKAGAPAVIGRQDPDARETLVERAYVAGARPFVYGEDWSAHLEHGRLVYQDDTGLKDLTPPRLAGPHQVDNAGLAIAAATAAGLTLTQAQISQGLLSATWPARLQRLRSGPLVEIARRALGDGPEVWLDGGHNPHAARAIARAMADFDDRASKPLVLVTGMLPNKDAHGYFAAFADLAAAVVATRTRAGAPAEPETLAAAAIAEGIPAAIAPTLEAAMERACAVGSPAPRILICGSLYLAGEVLEENA